MNIVFQIAKYLYFTNEILRKMVNNLIMRQGFMKPDLVPGPAGLGIKNKDKWLG